MATRLKIVGANKLMCECLAAALRTRGELIVTEAGGNLEATRSVVGRKAPDVLLVDASRSLAEVRGLVAEVTRNPAVKVLLLGIGETRDGLRCMEAGASGFLPPEASLAELRAAIDKVRRGELVYSPQVASTMFVRLAELSRRRRRRGRPERPKLTPREREILALVAAKLPTPTIGERLGISPHTVKNHVHNILKKLGVHYRQEAVRIARDRGWLGPAGSAGRR
jgi:DNA-binding NarL/FixJ family response regulator